MVEQVVSKATDVGLGDLRNKVADLREHCCRVAYHKR